MSANNDNHIPNIAQTDTQTAPNTESAIKAAQQQKYKYVIQNKEVDKRLKHKKIVAILLIALLIIALLGGLIYGTLSFLENNNFKIVVERKSLQTFTLSKQQAFTNPSGELEMQGPDVMSDVTLLDIFPRLDAIKAHEGSFAEVDKAKNYMAATFFLRNETSQTARYRESVEIQATTKGMCEAMRVLIIRTMPSGETEYDCYAQPRKDGEAEQVIPTYYCWEDENGKKNCVPHPPGCFQQGQVYTTDFELTSNANATPWLAIPFVSSTYVSYDPSRTIPPSAIIRYTFIVWLEGWDPECDNSIIGDITRLEFRFTAI
ncbi:MAG: hypothetical protein FWD49_01925 [Firmicutes bacterium]|nr:hypothetical protein [Bacillota bacterium]